MNDGVGCVVETRCMFHEAWPALNQPGLSPRRRSGLGADVDMSGAGTALPAMVIAEPDVAQPATTSRPRFRASDRTRNALVTKTPCVDVRGDVFRSGDLTGSLVRSRDRGGQKSAGGTCRPAGASSSSVGCDAYCATS